MQTIQLQVNGPHNGAQLFLSGAPLAQARLVLVMLHGRGASALDLLSLAEELDIPGAACLAPDAVESQWYPLRFLAPSAHNQPWLDSALEVVAASVQHAQDAGFADAQIYLLGFSQGACLALEWAARSGRRLGGVFGLSGGLIGTDAEAQNHSGDLGGVPVFLGCSDVDPHIPRERVEQTAQVFAALGADVTLRLYQGMGHTININEIEFIQSVTG